MSLREIETESKIRMIYLEAIESEDFARLPGEVYSVSYIRQYARAIDYDENLILECYYKQVAPTEPPLVSQPPRERRTLGALLRIFHFV